MIENMEHQVAITWSKVDGLGDLLKEFAAEKIHTYSSEMKSVTEKVH